MNKKNINKKLIYFLSFSFLFLSPSNLIAVKYSSPIKPVVFNKEKFINKTNTPIEISDSNNDRKIKNLPVTKHDYKIINLSLKK